MEATLDQRRQRTIAAAINIEGIGLHTGAPTRLRCKPAGPGTGIVFVRTDLPDAVRIAANAVNRAALPRRTALAVGDAQVHTVEHLLSAVHGLHIDNLEIEIDGPEVPGLDGSARDFVAHFKKAGIADQEASVEPILLQEAVAVSHKGASIVAFPNGGKGLRVSYTLDYPIPSIKSMFLAFEFSPASYEAEVASARTFVLRAEADMMRQMGMGLGATTDNTVVFDTDEVVGTTLRFDNEPCRHKVLDLIGDLALLGRPLHADIVAVKSGHELNLRLVQGIEATLAAAAGAPIPELEAALGPAELKELLPHRYPFLLVDRITAADETRARGLKNVTINEPFFQGHFPKDAVMPGALIVEALGQLGAAALRRAGEVPDGDVSLTGLEGWSFKAKVRPGDQLILETELVRRRGGHCRVRGEARVGDRRVCAGLLSLVFSARDEAGSC